MNQERIDNLLSGIRNVALALRKTIENPEPGDSVRKLSEEEWIELYRLVGLLQKNVQQIQQEQGLPLLMVETEKGT